MLLEWELNDMDHYIILKKDYKNKIYTVTTPLGEKQMEVTEDDNIRNINVEQVLLKWALEQYRKIGEYGKWYLAVDKPDFKRYEMVNDLEIVFDVTKERVNKYGDPYW